jgi:hypothetical protein
MTENGPLLGLTGPAGREASTSAETPQAWGERHKDRGFGYNNDSQLFGCALDIL